MIYILNVFPSASVLRSGESNVSGTQPDSMTFLKPNQYRTQNADCCVQLNIGDKNNF